LTLYLDASVLIPLVVTEPQHPDVAAFLAHREAPFIVTSFARGEVVSGLARQYRKRLLARADIDALIYDLEAWYAANCRSPFIEDSDIRVATTFVRRFELGLRLPDAIHLAAAQRLGLPILTLDQPLVRAADRLGIPVLSPG
jgi:hypothetical protein